jgi:pimeloyl-ACP methyl ester carboxylesterase
MAMSLRAPVTAPTGGNAPRVAFTILGLAIGVIVGWDGSTAGRLIRTGVVLIATGSGAVFVREARQPRRDWLRVTAGLVGTVAGLGIGLPHLTHGSYTAPGIAGLVALLAGLWLLVGGTVELVRTARNWKKLVAIPVAALLAVFVIYPVSMTLYATNLPSLSLDPATPADSGLTFFDASFPTEDGVTLSGWYIPSSNGAAVVLAHGASQTRSQLLTYAAVLARHGFGVLLYDARGHGRSGGRAMEYGWFGDRDVTAAISYTSSQLDVHPGWVGAVGVGLGADQVVAAAARDARIKAVVSDGATGRALSDTGWLPTGPTGWVRRGVDAVAYGTASLLSDAAQPASLRAAVTRAAQTPFLLIAGDGPSAHDEQSAARWIEGAAPTRTRLWTSPGAGRGAAFAAHPDQWESVVTAFLTTALLRK